MPHEEWEYLLVRASKAGMFGITRPDGTVLLPKGRDLLGILNELGNDGWELGRTDEDYPETLKTSIKSVVEEDPDTVTTEMIHNNMTAKDRKKVADRITNITAPLFGPGSKVYIMKRKARHVKATP
jgi:hypothetical protein